MPTNHPTRDKNKRERNKNNLFVLRCIWGPKLFFCWREEYVDAVVFWGANFANIFPKKWGNIFLLRSGKEWKKMTQRSTNRIYWGGGIYVEGGPSCNQIWPFFPFLFHPPPPPPGNRKWFREFEIIHITRFPARINRRSIHNRRIPAIPSHPLCRLRMWDTLGWGRRRRGLFPLRLNKREKNIGGIRWSHVPRHLRFLMIHLAPLPLLIAELKHSNFAIIIVRPC